MSKARTCLSAGSAKDNADKIFRSILERGLVKGTGVTKDKQIPSMDKLNISLLPIVSIYLLHPATSKLLVPLPNRLMVQLLRTIASFPSTSRPGPSTFSFQSGSWGINILYLSIDWFQVLPYCIPFVSTSITASVIFWPCLHWSIPWDPHGRSIHETPNNQANEDQSVHITSSRSRARSREEKKSSLNNTAFASYRPKW